MKKIIIILSFMLVASITKAGDRETVIRIGQTMISPAISLNASDTINANDTITFTITNLQRYAQQQTFSIGLTTVSGAPNVTIKAYGKVTTSSSWVQIGSTITWTTSANNGDITSTSPINYNYLKVDFIANATAQQTKITNFIVKTSNAFDIPANSGTLTVSRATSGTVTVTSKDDDANAALIIAAGGTGALTLGDANSTAAIASSDWAIGTTGIMTGIGAITTDGLLTASAGATISGAATSINASSNFATNIGTGSTNAAVSIGGGSNTVAINSSAWDISIAGAVTGVTTIASSGTITNTTDGDNIVIDAGTDLHAIDVQINSASKFNVDTAGNIAIAGILTGGYKLPAPILNTDGTETLDASMSGKMCILSKADGVSTVTIPDPSAATVGVVYYILQTADQNFTVTSTTADNNGFVCDGVATSDAVTCSTAGHLIGGGMIVIGISTTKWYVGALNPEEVLTPEAAD